ncbi:serine hydrolase domain-containing protein [Shewanella sediminis]|nr:serine hydrolase domain-containing protein [Shewanella sediminis]
MNKTLLAFSLLVSFGSSAADFQGRDATFLENAAQHMISVKNYDSGENAASTFPHAYKFTHSYRISHGLLGSGQDVLSPEVLKSDKQLDFSKIMITDIDGQMDLNTFLRDRLKNHSMVVVNGDRLLHEHYWNNMDEHSTHLMMSVTKSFTSMMAAIAVSEGKLDMSKPVIHYLPELKGTAWETASVQEVADMRTSVIQKVSKHKSWDDRMTLSQSYNGDTAGDYPRGVTDYFPLVTKVETKMGKKYTYQCVNTEVLGKVVEAATGKRLADLIEDNIWKKVGLENDAFLMSDHVGGAVASGGLNAATKDMARIGKVLMNDGKNYLGEQVIPSDFISGLLQGDDNVRSAWKLSKEASLADGWYKDQFRLLNVGGYSILAMVGIHGQVVAMDKASGTVIAMNGGYPMTETPRMAISLFHKVIPAILDAVEH